MYSCIVASLLVSLLDLAKSFMYLYPRYVCIIVGLILTGTELMHKLLSKLQQLQTLLLGQHSETRNIVTDGRKYAPIHCDFWISSSLSDYHISTWLLFDSVKSQVETRHKGWRQQQRWYHEEWWRHQYERDGWRQQWSEAQTELWWVLSSVSQATQGVWAI